jgi:hypothetical protein
MSLFLGKIHFWLFDKIKCFEDLENEIINFAQEKGVKNDLHINEMYEFIGYPTEDKPLDELIDTSNIHGWLQLQIQKAEKRQAYLIKNLKAINKNYIEELKTVFENHGRKMAKLVETSPQSPEEAYSILNNFLLEGMPCDKTVDFFNNDEERISFSFIRCLHKKYWDEFDADISDYYNLRNCWISGFINSLDENYEFEVDVKDPTYVNILHNIFHTVKK